MDRKVPDEEEKKKQTKKKSSSGCHNPFLIHAQPLWRWFIDYGRDVNYKEIEEFVFGYNIRKKESLLTAVW